MLRMFTAPAFRVAPRNASSTTWTINCTARALTATFLVSSASFEGSVLAAIRAIRAVRAIPAALWESLAWPSLMLQYRTSCGPELGHLETNYAREETSDLVH